MRARLLNFYSFREDEVNRMPMSKVVDYNTCIDIVKAQDALLSIQTSNFSKYKPSTQNKIIRRLRANAQGLIKKTAKGLATYGGTLKALQGMLSGRRSD